ncbi:fungal-specific transcription factor domain-containing protein [Lasiosphaeria hispida]|uniref:Fungal-specific transcription factor domain-containing protein n=1 Tax=Lasiosphaeria hispida TaxID=260671 RepID=A0AAJ0H8B8_9PEZI|nr:fungal-specific transcription factor domain-containing protein [Lasiosphaeria hispida]
MSTHNRQQFVPVDDGVDINVLNAAASAVASTFANSADTPAHNYISIAPRNTPAFTDVNSAAADAPPRPISPSQYSDSGLPPIQPLLPQYQPKPKVKWKRKRNPESEYDSEPKVIKRISRACDNCTGRRMKCQGFLPCDNCTKRGLTCSYVKPHVRGRIVTPPPPPEDDPGARNYAPNFRIHGKDQRFRSWNLRACDRCRIEEEDCSGKLPCSGCFTMRVECSFKLRPGSHYLSGGVDPSTVSRQRASDSAGADDTLPDAEGPLVLPAEEALKPLDPETQKLQPALRYANERTPPLVFLHRAWKKIAEAHARWTQGEPPHNSGDRIVMPLGDQPFDESHPFKLPEQHRWAELLEQFLEGGSATFHFLHHPSVRTWMEAVEKNYSTRADLSRGVGPVRTAIVLMALALGSFWRDRAHRDKRKNKVDEWIWTLNFGDQVFTTALRLTDPEKSNPSLELVQARLLQDIYLFSTHRTTQGWLNFGNTLQMITALGLHRRLGRNRGLGLDVTENPNYVKIQLERRVFWSAYILDKQLSLMFGRPSHFSDDTTDQELPDAINDEDASPIGPFRASPSDSYVHAMVAHAKLNKLVERTVREVYSLREMPDDYRLVAALNLGLKLDYWREHRPPILAHHRLTTLLPIFRRQATILKLAYCHAEMLIHRPFLMIQYPTTGERKADADSSIRKCVRAAKDALQLVVSLYRDLDKIQYKAFWFAHYVGYCAATIMWLVPHVRERQLIFGGPEFRGNEKTDKEISDFAVKLFAAYFSDSSHPYSPCVRWAIIMKEIIAEADVQLKRVPVQENEPQNTNDENSTADADADADGQDESDEDGSPNEQLLEDAFRAHWEADIPVPAPPAPAGPPPYKSPLAHLAPPGVPFVPPLRLWDTWKITDWLDLDSAAFGPISDFAPPPSLGEL